MGNHLDAHDQASQLFYHVVERVGEYTQRISGHFCLYAKVSFTDAADFTDQLFNLRLQVIALGLCLLYQVHNVIQHTVHRGCDHEDLIAA